MCALHTHILTLSPEQAQRTLPTKMLGTKLGRGCQPPFRALWWLNSVGWACWGDTGVTAEPRDKVGCCPMCIKMFSQYCCPALVPTELYHVSFLHCFFLLSLCIPKHCVAYLDCESPILYFDPFLFFFLISDIRVNHF